MNETVVKRALIFSLILGAFIGIVSLLPVAIGFALFILMFLSSPIIIIYMKKNEKHLSFINNEQGAILGAIIGFGATIGFFASFSPLVCILKLIFLSIIYMPLPLQWSLNLLSVYFQ